MVTIYQKNNSITRTEGETKEIEFRGLSTDEKPVSLDEKDIPNGTMFIEIDTGKMYLYDLDNEQWNEV